MERNFKGKEKIITVYEVPSSIEGDPYIRVPNIKDKDPKTMRLDRETGELITLWEEKMRYPYKTLVYSRLHIKTDRREFSVPLFLDNGEFFWNGQNIPTCLWSFIGISKYSPEGLQASKWHDILLYKKSDYFKEFKKTDKKMSVNEYRRLTSLIFRQLLMNYGVSRTKAYLMSWIVDQCQKIRFIVSPIKL